jgi:hypothetical protein
VACCLVFCVGGHMALKRHPPALIGDEIRSWVKIINFEFLKCLLLKYKDCKF